MAFTPRTRAQIRDAILSFWQSRHRADGRDLVIARGSDAYKQAESMALVFEAIEAQAGQIRNEILPDKASTEYLNRHATVDGLSRNPATAAVLTWTITGVGNSLITFGSSVIQFGSLKYKPNVPSVTLSGGTATVTCTCQTLGTDGNLSVGTTGTWSTTPANANATATVQAVVTTAENEETDTDFAKRIMDRRAARPGSGNVADWRDWVKQCDGVEEAYTYPLTKYESLTFYPDTDGCVTVLALGPKPGDKPAYDGNDWGGRRLTSTRLAQIADFIEGLRDKGGVSISNGTMLRPASMRQGNYAVQSPTFVTQTLRVRVQVSAAYAYGAGATTPGTIVSSTHNSVRVNSNAAATVGSPLAFYVGPGYKRGAWVIATPISYSFVSSDTILNFPDNTFDPSYLPTNSPVFSGGWCASAANWNEVRLAILDYFDSFGPLTLVSPSARFPDSSVVGPSYVQNKLISTILTVPGVTDVTSITLTGSTPFGTQMYALTELQILPPI